MFMLQKGLSSLDQVLINEHTAAGANDSCDTGEGVSAWAGSWVIDMLCVYCVQPGFEGPPVLACETLACSHSIVMCVIKASRCFRALNMASCCHLCCVGRPETWPHTNG